MNGERAIPFASFLVGSRPRCIWLNWFQIHQLELLGDLSMIYHKQSLLLKLNDSKNQKSCINHTILTKVNYNAPPKNTWCFFTIHPSYFHRKLPGEPFAIWQFKISYGELPISMIKIRVHLLKNMVFFWTCEPTIGYGSVSLFISSDPHDIHVS